MINQQHQQQQQPRLPRNRKALVALLNEEHRRAYSIALLEGQRNGGREENARLQKDINYRQQLARVSVLESICKLTNSYGQMMDALAKALQSEHGQL